MIRRTARTPIFPWFRCKAVACGTKTEHESEGHERGVRGIATEPDRLENGNALAWGEPVIERVGTRSDRGAGAQRAFSREVPVEGRTLVGSLTLAGLTRIDPQFLPVKYRSVQAQARLTVVQARAGLVRGQATLINTARGLTKSHRERLRDSYPQDLNPSLNSQKDQELNPELQAALEPALIAIESLSERFREAQPSNQQIARRQAYSPE